MLHRVTSTPISFMRSKSGLYKKGEQIFFFNLKQSMFNLEADFHNAVIIYLHKIIDLKRYIEGTNYVG